MYAAAFFEGLNSEMKVLRSKIVDGLDTKDLLGTQSLAVWRFRRQIRNRILEILTRVKNFGIGQVHDELKRQE